MEFGLFTEFQCPAGMREAAAFDESMAQMRAAEDLGFDAVWLPEIHFQKDRSVLASPLVGAAALPTWTPRAKTGTAGQVFPLSHPLRLPEEVAAGGHLTEGPPEFGVRPGGLPGASADITRAGRRRDTPDAATSASAYPSTSPPRSGRPARSRKPARCTSFARSARL